MKEETAVELKEELAVEMREGIREEIAAEVLEEIRVQIKDGEFGVLVNEEGGENQAEIYPKKQDGENQTAEYPQKQANGLKLRNKGNPEETSDNSKDAGKQSIQKARQDIGNITENGSRYSQLQDTQFKCKQCDKRFTIKRELLRHTKIVHEGKTRMFKIREIQNL